MTPQHRRPSVPPVPPSAAENGKLPDADLPEVPEALDGERAHVALADIVRLKQPYQSRIDRQKGPFGFGIVAEILSVRPDGRTHSVSLYLYDPQRREIFLGPNGIPEFVDCHCTEFVLYKRAADQGYLPLV